MSETTPNIGPKGCRRRLTTGVVFTAISLAIAVGLSLAGASRLWRLSIFLPLLVGGVGMFQSFEKT